MVCTNSCAKLLDLGGAVYCIVYTWKIFQTAVSDRDRTSSWQLCCLYIDKLKFGQIRIFMAGPIKRDPDPTMFIKYWIYKKSFTIWIRIKFSKSFLTVLHALLYSISDPHKFLCGSGSGPRIPKMSIWIRIQEGKTLKKKTYTKHFFN